MAILIFILMGGRYNKKLALNGTAFILNFRKICKVLFIILVSFQTGGVQVGKKGV
jgi:hypothetical protein